MADHLKTGGRPIFLPFLAATLEDCLPAGVAIRCFCKFFDTLKCRTGRIPSGF